MYQISRSLYRRLEPRVVGAPGDTTGSRNRQQVLEACEAAMLRLAEDRRYFRHPVRWLFEEIRGSFSIRDQLLVYSVIERYVQLAHTYLQRLPQDATPFGEAPACRAMTRRENPCRREPLPGMEYCPSHKHLEESDAWRENTAAA
jgi:hypothetical protein